MASKKVKNVAPSFDFEIIIIGAPKVEDVGAIRRLQMRWSRIDLHVRYNGDDDAAPRNYSSFPLQNCPIVPKDLHLSDVGGPNF